MSFSVKPAAVDSSDVAVYYLSEPEAVSIQWNHSQLYRDFNFSLQIFSDCDQEKVRITIILLSAHAPIMNTLIVSEKCALNAYGMTRILLFDTYILY